MYEKVPDGWAGLDYAEEEYGGALITYFVREPDGIAVNIEMPDGASGWRASFATEVEAQDYAHLLVKLHVNKAQYLR